MEEVGQVAAISVAAILAWSALAKLRSPRTFSEAINSYELVGSAAATPIALATIALEALAALLLTAPSTRKAGSLLAAGLFVAFVLAMASVVHRRLQIPCACLGSTNADRAEPVGVVTIARTAALAVCAALAVRWAPSRGYGSLTEVASAVLLISAISASASLARLLVVLREERNWRYRPSRAAPLPLYDRRDGAIIA